MGINIGKQKKQVISLYSASVFGLLVGVAVSVLNTRFLAPDEYGDVRYVQNMISFISGLLLLGYFVSGSRLLALSKDEQYSRSIRGIMVAILCIAIAFVMICMLIFAVVNNNIGKTNLAILFFYAIPVCGNVLMLHYINTVAQGDNHIGRISIARLVPSVIYLITAFPIFHILGASGVLMLLLYNGASVLVLGLVIWSTQPSFKNLKESFAKINVENRKYGFNVYMGSIIGVSTQYIAGISLGHFCVDNSNVGFYTLGLTLASPLSMLPGIIGTTYFKKFAKDQKIDNRVFVYSIIITLLSLVVFWIFIKYIVAFLYSVSYAHVSSIASYLAIGTCIHGFGDMINRFLGAHGKGKEIRNGAINCGLCSIIGNVLLVYLWGINGAIVTKIMASGIYTLSMLYYYSSLKNNCL